MILIAVYSRSQWTIINVLARELKSRGDVIGVVWFGSAVGIAQEFVRRQAVEAGCAFFVREDYAVDIPVGIAGPGKLHNVLPQDHPYRQLVRRQIGGARRLLDETNAAMLVVCEDGPGGDSALIASAKQCGIPVLVVPFGIGESRDYDVFIEDKRAEGNLNFVPVDDVGAFLRDQGMHWIRRTDYGDICLFPAEFVAARLLEGLDLPNPWVVHGGHADLIAVESAAMERHYLREGLPASKLASVGSVYCDAILQSLNQDEECVAAHESRGKIRKGSTSILVSLPPSYHSTRAAHCEFATYETMCRQVMAFCSNLEGVNLTVSIHPNSSEESRRAILQAGAQVSDEWLVSLIPRHDIFFTVFSSTIRWAIAAGKPVVNYDLYGFGLTTYHAVPSVVECRRFEQVRQVLARWTSDDGAFRSAAMAQSEQSSDWGVLDGRNFERIYSLMQQMVANQH